MPVPFLRPYVVVTSDGALAVRHVCVSPSRRPYRKVLGTYARCRIHRADLIAPKEPVSCEDSGQILPSNVGFAALASGNGCFRDP